MPISVGEHDAARLLRRRAVPTRERPMALPADNEREPEGRIKWLEPVEEERLLGACAESDNSQLLSIVTIALETGMRYGEIMGMTWERVDLSRGVIRLDLTKSGRRREVPMRQAVYDALAKRPGERKGRVWSEQSIRTAWETAVEQAKLDDRHFHDCRHHFASWFVMRGGSLQALKEILRCGTRTSPPTTCARKSPGPSASWNQLLEPRRQLATRVPGKC